MGEVKKAWEIAMEKAQNITELSREQVDKYTAERCLMIGNNLANRYLEELDLSQLELELNKHTDKEKKFVKQAVAKKLILAIEINNQEKFTAVEQALFLILKEKAMLKETIEKIKVLFDQYDQVNQKKKKKLEVEGRKILTTHKISGEAIIGINPVAKNKWQQDLVVLKQSYEERLNPLKQELETQTSKEYKE